MSRAADLVPLGPTETTTMRFETTHHLPVPPDKAFAYATDLNGVADRVRGIVRCEVLTEGPIGLGTRFRETRIVMKREATETMEFTSFDPPRAYTVGADSHGCRFRTDFTFEAAGDGTDVRLVFVAEPYTIGARVMGLLFRRMMKRCLVEVTRDLDDLARAVEAEEGIGAK